jgi:hypothetical protein
MRLMKPSEKKISLFLNSEVGKRIFVLSNGPSILDEDLSLLKGEVVIGMNASTILESSFGFESKYYVLSDPRFINETTKRPMATQMLSSSTHRIIRSDMRSIDDPSLESRTSYIRAISRDGFSTNLSVGFYYGCTTTMLALQLAWYLGSREVYLLGCDLRYPEESPRFYAELKPQMEDAFISVQLSNIVNASQVFEKTGGSLINCSARSFLRSYIPFINFSNVFDVC